MNKKMYYTIGVLSILAVLLTAGCNTKNTTGKVIKDIRKSAQPRGSIENPHYLVMKIEGMYCASCGPGIARMLSESEGIVIAKVSRADKKGEVIYDADKISKEAIIAILKDPYKGTILADMPATEKMIEAVNALRNE